MNTIIDSYFFTFIFFYYKCIYSSKKYTSTYIYLYSLVVFCHYLALEQMVPNAIKTYLD